MDKGFTEVMGNGLLCSIILLFNSASISVLDGNMMVLFGLVSRWPDCGLLLVFDDSSSFEDFVP